MSLLRVLVVDDQKVDAELMVAALQNAGYSVAWQWVDNEARFRDLLSSEFDLVLSDYQLAQFDGGRALKLLHEYELGVPFVVVSSIENPETAVECMKMGADDYVLKSQLARLGLVVGRALNDKRLREEKRQAELALRENEQRYRQMVELSPDLILIHVDDEIVFINSRGAQLLGAASPQDIEGNHIMNIIHPDYRGLANRRIELLERGVRVPFTEDRFLRLDGKPLDLEVIAVASVYQGQHAIQVFGRDISERKRSQLALQQSDEKFGVVFRESLDAILIVDAESELIFSVNPATHRILKYDAQDILGQHFSILFPTERKIQERELIHRLRAYGAVLESQAFLRGDGVVIPMDLTATLIPWDHGKAIVVTLRDVSDRLQIEEERLQKEELRRALQKEKEIGELRNRFMSIVSHEFRTPLAVILTSSELLERYGDRLSPERKATGHQTIKKQVEHLSQMMDDISVIIRAESGKLQFNPTPIDMKQVCKELLEEMHLTVGMAHHLVFESDGDFDHMPIDYTLLNHILKNLLTNAIKYSPEGGEVRLRLGRRGTHTILLEVSDNGIGIPADDQTHLFEPYFRASNVGNISGTGLGLRIVKDAVELHGGTIRIESEVGKGTTFTIYLPILRNLA